MSIYVGDTEIKDISLGEGLIDYSAMQGPCPEGFHVPNFNDRYNVWSILKDLGFVTKIAGNWCQGDISTILHLPIANSLNYNGSTLSDCFYHISTKGGANAWGNYYVPMRLQNNAATFQNGRGNVIGCFIRPFKDESIIPDNTRNRLYGTGNTGIYHSSSLGLISISSDGQNWITIADKNLGATTVRNSGNTLSEANCGKHYQRGNNYGFPYSGSFTTSSTQIDASNYGPGNYYSSNIFITGNNAYASWSTSDNWNLRGGETGVVKKGNVKEVYVGDKRVRPMYFATQGPCPDGFHVPLNTEWQAIYDAGISLGAWTSNGSNNVKTYLKLPYAGMRGQSNGIAVNQNSVGIYWMSNVNEQNRCYNFQIAYNSTISPQYTGQNMVGFSIRPFMNKSVTPDNTRNRLYGTGNTGIYHSSSLGLISISSDGQNWITIADKNLGATQAYNDGDTLSESNCGKFYQRGNNYGFPRTGSVTTSGTTINASNYGPGNYYNSSTFITGFGSWDSSNNKNLRGGEDGNVLV